jgi:hypothetical protein
VNRGGRVRRPNGETDTPPHLAEQVATANGDNRAFSPFHVGSSPWLSIKRSAFWIRLTVSGPALPRHAGYGGQVRCRAGLEATMIGGQGSELYVESCRSGRVTESSALPRVPLGEV